MGMSEEEEVTGECAWALMEQLEKATSNYVEVVRQLRQTYKKEWEILQLGIVMAVYVPDVHRLSRGDFSFTTDDVRTEVMVGPGRYVRGMINGFKEKMRDE